MIREKSSIHSMMDKKLFLGDMQNVTQNTLLFCACEAK
jgi:hypothetical protein